MYQISKSEYIKSQRRNTSNQNSKYYQITKVFIAQSLLLCYSRNICTSAETKTIFGDVKANLAVTDTTLHEYINALVKLYVIDDLDAWCPAIRSKTVIRASRKRNLIDPSIAAAAMGLAPSYFMKDFKTLGFLFESLCIRDLKVYSSAMDGKTS